MYGAGISMYGAGISMYGAGISMYGAGIIHVRGRYIHVRGRYIHVWVKYNIVSPIRVMQHSSVYNDGRPWACVQCTIRDQARQ